MLPSLLYNPLAARYRTLDECYKSYSSAKATAFKHCLVYSNELTEAFKPEFAPIVNAGISAFNCMMFSFTSDIYVPFPVYSRTGDTTATQHCLICRMHVTKDHTTYSFSHEVYRLPDTVLLRLFDICPNDIGYYYSFAERQAIRREAGEKI